MVCQVAIFRKIILNNFQLFALLGFSRSKVEASGHLDVDGGAFSAPLRSWILGFGLWSMGAQCYRIPPSRGSLWVEVLTVGWLVGWWVGGLWVTWGPCDVKNKKQSTETVTQGRVAVDGNV